MARTSPPVKLLDKHGSVICWVYAREMSEMISKGRATLEKSKRKGLVPILRIVELPKESNSKSSPCMPTINDIHCYVGVKDGKKRINEIRAKINACRTHIVGRAFVGEQDYLTEGEHDADLELIRAEAA